MRRFELEQIFKLSLCFSVFWATGFVCLLTLSLSRENIFNLYCRCWSPNYQSLIFLWQLWEEQCQGWNELFANKFSLAVGDYTRPRLKIPRVGRGEGRKGWGQWEGAYCIHALSVKELHFSRQSTHEPSISTWFVFLKNKPYHQNTINNFLPISSGLSVNGHSDLRCSGHTL